MASAKSAEAVVAPGIVTEADSEDGQLVSEPDGHVGELVGELRGARRGEVDARRRARWPAARCVTVSPLTSVTVSGAPLPEKRASVG